MEDAELPDIRRIIRLLSEAKPEAGDRNLNEAEAVSSAPVRSTVADRDGHRSSTWLSIKTAQKHADQGKRIEAARSIQDARECADRWLMVRT